MKKKEAFVNVFEDETRTNITSAHVSTGNHLPNLYGYFNFDVRL